jgi:hypothetical protein
MARGKLESSAGATGKQPIRHPLFLLAMKSYIPANPARQPPSTMKAQNTSNMQTPSECVSCRKVLQPAEGGTQQESLRRPLSARSSVRFWSSWRVSPVFRHFSHGIIAFNFEPRLRFRNRGHEPTEGLRVGNNIPFRRGSLVSRRSPRHLKIFGRPECRMQAAEELPAQEFRRCSFRGGIE